MQSRCISPHWPVAGGETRPSQIGAQDGDESIIDPPATACSHCGKSLGHRRFDLERRVESLVISQMGPELEFTLEVQSAEDVGVYCDHMCWQLAEPELARIMRVRATYPSFSFVAACCRCGGPVDRTQPYVCYPVCDMVYSQTKPAVAECVDERAWLVICVSCDVAAEQDASVRLVEEFALA